jgi:hypothetical protein
MDDFAPHVWVTRDYGESWTDLSAGLPQDDYVKVLRQHPDNPDLLFVGMERGIQASWDGGETWVDLRLGLPRVSVRGIKIQREYNDLVIGTHGRGAFILDDIEPLVALADALDDDVHLFDVRTATDWEMWGRTSNLGQSFFVGENPEGGAWIHYHLSDAAADALDEPVRVRITDASGALVREFTDDDAGPGINRAVWDLHWAGPEPVPGEAPPSGWWGRMQGPPAVPGTYTATLVVNGSEYSTDVEVRADPNVSATLADLEARHATAMRARELQSRLNAMVGTMQDVQSQLGALGEAMEGKEIANAARIRELSVRAETQLTELKDEVERPDGSMSYRDWPRLVEQLRFVVRGIQGAQARPTEGQLEVLEKIETDTAQRADELQAILDGVIAELNELLEDTPKIMVDRGRLIS